MVTRTSKTVAKKSPSRTPARKRTATPPAEFQPQLPDPVPEADVKPVASGGKQKLVRDSFTIPKNEYEVLAALKARALALGHASKKSELIRAGIATLAALGDTELLGMIGGVAVVKTGRPPKTKEAKPAKRKG